MVSESTEKAEEEIRESKIRPIEPIEPLNPLEPFGGMYLGGGGEVGDSLDGEVKAAEAGDGFEEVELNLAKDLASQGEIVKDTYKTQKKRLSMYEVTAENDISSR